MEIEDTYIDLKVVHTLKLGMHDDLTEKGLVIKDEDGNYVIADGRDRELIDYMYENSSDPTVEVTVGD